MILQKLKDKTNPMYGKHHSETTKLKMRMNHVDISGEKNPMWGKHHSEETKRKIGLIHKGKIGPFRGMLGEKHPWFGRFHTEKTKEKIRASKFGEKNPNYGKSPSEETKEKMRIKLKGRKLTLTIKQRIRRSESKRGNKNPNYGIPRFKGRHHSIETKKILSKLNMGKHPSIETRIKLSEIHKKQWQNKEYRNKVITATLKSLFKRPTSLEQKMIDIIKQNNLPYAYTGNGSFLIGYKNPDFVNNNGEKICLEVRAKVICQLFDKQTPTEYERQRKEHFAKYGWECIVIWDDDLLKNNLENIFEVLKR